MRLIKLELLKPIEGHSKIRVKNMAHKIKESGIWQRPISVEGENMLILDGHHRFEVAKILHLSHLPCEFFFYSDPNLKVWSLRDDCEVSKDLVIERSLAGNIYPYKTAKHGFPRAVNKCLLPLESLYKMCESAKGDIVEL